MELRVKDGKYLERRYAGLETVSGAQEIAQRITMKLSCRRGGFFPMPDFGSRLHLLHTIKPSERHSAAELYIAEALSGERDVNLAKLEITDYSEGRIGLRLVLEYMGEAVLIKTTI